MTPDTSAISCTELCLRYASATSRVLNHLSLNIPTGAVVGLVGRNGAGKSTLLRCLVGLSVPDSGASQVLDCPSLRLNDPVRERLGYVAQTPDLFDWMDVWEHIEAIGRAYARWTPERALTLSAQLGVPMGKKVSELSVGDRQKLSVVLALAHDPDVVIMDEPVASLDPLARRDFMRALFAGREESQPPRTVLISSHLLSDLERVVSHVAFIRNGQVQLFDEWDAMGEHLRVTSGPGIDPALHTSAEGRALIDTRVTGLVPDAEPVSLDELFVLLNT